MNFSFYQKYLFLSFLFLSLLIGFSRCVPIEDLSQPLISNFELKTQYNISDTIRLKAILRDNFGIQAVRIDIQSATNTPNSWVYTKTIDSVGARLLNLEDFTVTDIPIATLLGDYELILTVIDVSGLEQSIAQDFSIGKDISTPTFSDIELDLSLDSDLSITLLDPITNTYQVCRLDIIPISGTASDNVGLDKISAQFINFSNSPIFTYSLEGEVSVDLAVVFSGNRSIVIPNTVPNGTTLELVIKVTDIENNSSSDTLFLLVDCDNTIPIVNSLLTNPNINAVGTIEVIQGQELFITGGQVTDDEGLDSLFISFVSENTESLLRAEEISGLSFNIADLGDIPVSIPTTARVGSNYKLIVIAKDISGNSSVAYVSSILITRNAPPQILVANTYINNIETDFNLTSSNSILAGATVRIEGKIEEDVALEYYRITWGVAGQEQTIVDLDQATLEGELPFNFTNPLAENEFVVSETARAGTRYVLTLYVKDTLNAEVRVQYIFVVQ